MTSDDHHDGYHHDAPDRDCHACVQVLERAHADGAHETHPHPDCFPCGWDA
jgi:hypothetical protein